jgi:hypothetical protein
MDQRDFNRAASMLSELEPKVLRIFPPGHYWLGSLASVQALLASGTGDFKTAQLLADRSVDIVEAASKAGRAGSDFLPIALLRRATVELASSRPDRAAGDAQQALTQLRSASPSGEFSSVIGQAYLTLGRAVQAQGKGGEANAAFRSAAEHFQNTLGADHPDTRSALQLINVNTLQR